MDTCHCCCHCLYHCCCCRCAAVVQAAAVNGSRIFFDFLLCYTYLEVKISRKCSGMSDWSRQSGGGNGSASSTTYFPSSDGRRLAICCRFGTQCTVVEYRKKRLRIYEYVRIYYRAIVCMYWRYIIRVRASIYTQHTADTYPLTYRPPLTYRQYVLVEN